MPKRRKRGTRFADIAAAAGVGIATVDRVLNERGNVSAKTAGRVLDAARDLGVNRTLPSPWRRHRRYRVILSRERASVSDRLNSAFQRAAAPLQDAITLERNFVDEDDPQALSAEILKCEGAFDGLIVVPVDDPAVRLAVGRLARTMPVVTLVSDLRESGRNWFVGIDNYRAGRTVGFLCGRMVPKGGAVSVLWRGRGYTGQEERVRGFCDILESRFPGSPIEARSIECEDDRLHETAAAFLKERPDLLALYNAGLNEAPVARAVVEAGKAGELCYIGHELTPANADYLKAGILDFIIDQNPERQAQCALDLLLRRDRLIDVDDIATTSEFSIYCGENTGGGP